MQAAWRIGSLFGIPFYIDKSWLIILLLVTLANGANFAETETWDPIIAWTVGLALALLLFASVLLHELGHSLVAMSQGIKVNSITLFIFGGVASIDRESKTPGQAFQVAIAGPAVSFILFALLGSIAGYAPTASPIEVLALNLSRINLVLGVFNLIPGLPLDGGQVLKAAVWKLTGSRFQGIRWAALSGKTLGLSAIAFGVVLFLSTNSLSGIWIAFLGGFAVRTANAYNSQAQLQEALVKLKAEDAMTRQFRVIDANMTLREFAEEYILAETRDFAYFAASEGRYRGRVYPEDLRVIERSQWETQTVRSIVTPLSEIIGVEEDTPLVEAIIEMENHQLTLLTVFSKAGAVAGIIDRGDIVAAVAKKMNLPISPEQIKRIKEEGSYPAGFHLGAIAKATTEAVSPQEMSKSAIKK